MRKYTAGKIHKSAGPVSSGFVLCAAFFFFGALAGTLAASMADGGELIEYLSVAADVSRVQGDLAGALVRTFVWYLAAVLPGFCVAGFVILPLVAAARGFAMSFAVSVLMLSEGAWLPVLLVFALGDLIALPCFFVLMLQSLRTSAALTGRLLRRGAFRGDLYGKSYFLRCFSCGAVFLCAAFADTWAAPWLALLFGFGI